MGGVNGVSGQNRSPVGARSGPATAASEMTSPTPWSAANAAANRASFSGTQASSWSHRAITSPVHRRIAPSKFPVVRRLTGLTWTRTGNGAAAANRRATPAVSSAEQSSQTTTSSGGRVWATIDASCAGRNAAPLYAARATEIFTTPPPGYDSHRAARGPIRPIRPRAASSAPRAIALTFFHLSASTSTARPVLTAMATPSTAN